MSRSVGLNLRNPLHNVGILEEWARNARVNMSARSGHLGKQSSEVAGSGGGRPDLAEAGGKDTSALKSALQSIPSLLEPLL